MEFLEQTNIWVSNSSFCLLLLADDGMNLSGAMVASSFGKLVMKEDPRDSVKVSFSY